MGQNTSFGEIMLTCFKDEKLKRLMGIPQKEFKNLASFRDKYFVPQHGTADFVDSNIPVRIHMFWDDSVHTNNTDVYVRRLTFDVYVQKSVEYTATNFGLDRRHALITQRLKAIITGNRFGGFLFYSPIELDLNSNNYDFYRGFIKFNTKYIGH